ncbi:MAG TPA: tetratricopeptide repeat protein [Gemmatimonadales bacterium]|jgi:tetratricopeptide (TPR) repeat protein|nr:tetratricopeptide repeat protein [Gemmatimonadales bacterium]
MNLDKLKEAARKFEQREEWRRAIDVYLQAIREAEEAGEEGTQDPGLYNRVGDLQLKAGDMLAALRAYEQAAELYAEQGFFNNAIALCGKILRVNPSRTATYLRLAQLHARKNFVGEAKKNLLEYLERMNGVGQLEEAFTALKLFADSFSANPDIRLMLVELLRASSRNEDAREQLEKLAGELEARGETTAARRTRERLQSMGDIPERARPAASNDLVFLDTGATPIAGPEPPAGQLEAEPVEPLLEPEPLGAESLDAAAANEPMGFEPGVADSELDLRRAVGELEGMEDLIVTEASAAGPSSETEPPMFDLEESAPAAADVPGGGADSVLLQLNEALAAADFASHVEPGATLRERARHLLDAGDRAGGLRGLEESLRQLEAESRWDEALAVCADLVRLDPASIPRYQKQVELAYYAGRRPVLVAAYVELADALTRAGAVEHATQVYRRVLDHDESNQAARAALALLDPRPASGAAAVEEFVDLGALILGEEQPRDTRMRVGRNSQIEDEDQAFQEALADFKRGIENNLDAEDFQAHYDLGIAFKEMGLVDEAIAEFQKALRSSEGRLRTSEQLGIAFFEQGQFGIAEAVLRRAVSGLPGDEDDKIGLLYWLGRALESQGRAREALPLYEQALAVDIRFLDVRERAKRLAAELKS